MLLEQYTGLVPLTYLDSRYSRMKGSEDGLRCTPVLGHGCKSSSATTSQSWHCLVNFPVING